MFLGIFTRVQQLSAAQMALNHPAWLWGGGGGCAGVLVGLVSPRPCVLAVGGCSKYVICGSGAADTSAPKGVAVSAEA